MSTRRSYTSIRGNVLGSGEHTKDVVGLELKLLDLAKLVRTAQECQEQSNLLRGLQEQQLMEGLQSLQVQLQQLQGVVFAKPPNSCMLQPRASSAHSSATFAAATLPAGPSPGVPLDLMAGGRTERQTANELALTPVNECSCTGQLLLAQRSDLEALAARVQAIERTLERTALETRQAEAAREQSEMLVLERLIALECSVAGPASQPDSGAKQGKQPQQPHSRQKRLEEDIRQLRSHLDALAARVGSALAWLDGGEEDGGGSKLPPPAALAAPASGAAVGGADVGPDQVAAAASTRPDCDADAQELSPAERCSGSETMQAGALRRQGAVAGVGAGAASEAIRSYGPGAVVEDCSAEASMRLPAWLHATVDRKAQAAVAAALKAWQPGTSVSSAMESARMRDALGVVQGLSAAQHALPSSLGRLEVLCPRLVTVLQSLRSCNNSHGRDGDTISLEGEAAEGVGPRAEGPGGVRGTQSDPQLQEAYALAQEAGGLAAGLKETLAQEAGGLVAGLKETPAGVMAKGPPGGACEPADGAPETEPPPGAAYTSQAAPRWTGCVPVLAPAPIASSGSHSPPEAAVSVISLSQLAAPRSTAEGTSAVQGHQQPQASALPATATNTAVVELVPAWPLRPLQPQPAAERAGEAAVAAALDPLPFVVEAAGRAGPCIDGGRPHSPLLHQQQQPAEQPRIAVARAIDFTAPSAGSARGVSFSADAFHGGGGGGGTALASAADARMDSARLEPHAARHAGAAQPAPAPWVHGAPGVPSLLQHQQTQTSLIVQGSSAPPGSARQGHWGTDGCWQPAAPRSLAAANGHADARYRQPRRTPSGDSSRHLRDDVLLSSPRLSYDLQDSPRIQPLSRLAMAARRAEGRGHDRAHAASPATRSGVGRDRGAYGMYDIEDDVSRWGWLSEDEDEWNAPEEAQRKAQRRTTPPATRPRKAVRSKGAADASAAGGAARRTPRRHTMAGQRTPGGKAGGASWAEGTRHLTPMRLRVPGTGWISGSGGDAMSPSRCAAVRKGGVAGVGVGGGRGLGCAKRAAAPALAHTRLVGVGAVKSPIKFQ